jgi:hypothetical protein
MPVRALRSQDAQPRSAFRGPFSLRLPRLRPTETEKVLRLPNTGPEIHPLNESSLGHHPPAPRATPAADSAPDANGDTPPTEGALLKADVRRAGVSAPVQISGQTSPDTDRQREGGETPPHPRRRFLQKNEGNRPKAVTRGAFQPVAIPVSRLDEVSELYTAEEAREVAGGILWQWVPKDIGH